MPSLIFCFVVFSFFLRFVSSFEQSNGNCMILFTGFFFFCLLLLLKKWEMYHHIGLPFLKIQIRPLSSYVPNLPSRSISVSFQIGHTKMDFFFFKVQIRLDSFFKNSESSCEKVVVVFFVCSSSRKYKFGGLGCCCSAILCECCVCLFV